MEEHPDTVSRRADDPDPDPGLDVEKLRRHLMIAALPVAAIVALCLALGVPWWVVSIGVGVFVLILLFEA